jgi:hypothetical protein
VTSAQIVNRNAAIFKNYLSERANFVEEKKESLEYFEIFFNMESSKLINYLFGRYVLKLPLHLSTSSSWE